MIIYRYYYKSDGMIQIKAIFRGQCPFEHAMPYVDSHDDLDPNRYRIDINTQLIVPK